MRKEANVDRIRFYDNQVVGAYVEDHYYVVMISTLARSSEVLASWCLYAKRLMRATKPLS